MVSKNLGIIHGMDSILVQILQAKTNTYKSTKTEFNFPYYKLLPGYERDIIIIEMTAGIYKKN